MVHHQLWINSKAGTTTANVIVHVHDYKSRAIKGFKSWLRSRSLLDASIASARPRVREVMSARPSMNLRRDGEVTYFITWLTRCAMTDRSHEDAASAGLDSICR